MNLRLLYHGHCFDGVASAAYFTRFYHTVINPQAEVAYTGLMHRPGALFDEQMFDGEENAIVDFKYSPHEKLTWWFDHHQSAFLSREDEEHFKAHQGEKKFWDPQSKSCVEMIARIVKEKFGFEDSSLDSLVYWGHIIDGAFYESPTQAVELAEPALQLMQLIEAEKENSFIELIIRDLGTGTLEEVAAKAEVKRRLKPVLEQHQQTLQTIKHKSRCVFSQGNGTGIVSFDLVDEGIEGFNKFIPYYLHPNTTYTVALTHGAHRTKISVGSNPFSPTQRKHNIASICEKYGGGGHAVVGAVSLGVGEIKRGREIMQEIIAELLQ
ncbi:MAG: phosphoesterase [Pyrinomonadaceae bacterium]